MIIFKDAPLTEEQRNEARKLGQIVCSYTDGEYILLDTYDSKHPFYWDNEEKKWKKVNLRLVEI